LKERHHQPAHDADLVPLSILVADDEADDALLLQRAFEKAGIDAQLNFVHDGKQVLDYLRGTPPFANRLANPLPALLLLDLKMPRMDGFEVLEWLRQHPAFRRLAVIVFSGSDQPVDIERACALGAVRYLVKPPKFEDLLQMVRTVEKFLRKLAADRPLCADAHPMRI
jgi:CheY-like chemotaxis protein